MAPWRRSGLVLALTAALVLSGVWFTPRAAGYITRGPIVILDDAGFTPANGVVGGSGTSGDPYLIAGWEIAAASTNGIHVRNTNANFVIRDVSVIANTIARGFSAIRFDSVANGAVERAVLARYDRGVDVGDSSNIRVENSSIADVVSSGILAANSARVQVRNVDVERSGVGIEFASVTDSEIRNVRLTDHRLDGAYLVAPRNVTVSNLTASNNGRGGVGLNFPDGVVIQDSTTTDNKWGIWSYEGRGVGAFGGVASENSEMGIYILGTWNSAIGAYRVERNGYIGIEAVQLESMSVFRNQIAANGWGGISYSSVADSAITGNLISDHPVGIQLTAYPSPFRSGDIHVYGNGFQNNSLQAREFYAQRNVWNATYPIGGNYWSNYAGLDNCGGPTQDTCPGADGIGDTPFSIDSNRDMYPLMELPDFRAVRNSGPIAVARASAAEAFLFEPIEFNGSLSTDDVGVVRHAWDFGDGAKKEGAVVTHAYTLHGALRVVLTVWDVHGRSDTDSLLVVIGNRPPTAFAGVDLAVVRGTLVTLTGHGQDPDEDLLAFLWEQTTGPPADLQGRFLSSATFVPRELGTYGFRLRVQDRWGGIAEDDAIVVVENRPPYADAGPDRVAPKWSLVLLDARASQDPDGDALTFAWSQSGGPPAIIERADQAQASFFAQYAGVYTLSVTVRDSAGSVAQDTVTVEARNARPSAAIFVASRTIALGKLVSLDGRLSSDSDGTVVRYEWDFGDGSTATGTASSSHMFGAAGAYTVRLTVTDDDGGEATAAIVVTVATSPSNAPPEPMPWIIGIGPIAALFLVAYVLGRRRSR